MIWKWALMENYIFSNMAPDGLLKMLMPVYSVLIINSGNRAPKIAAINVDKKTGMLTIYSKSNS